MGKTKGRLRRNVRKTKGREKFLLEKSTPMVVKIVVNSTMTRAEKGQKKNAGRPKKKHQEPARRARRIRKRKRRKGEIPPKTLSLTRMTAIAAVKPTMTQVEQS